MKEIPTAEEFLDENNVVGMQHLIIPLIIEFAKLHVEQALKAACATLPYDDKMNQSMLDIIAINKSYPLENIK